MLRTGETVRKKRLEKGWSQSELARRSGVSQPTISTIELGTYGATESSLTALARALGCSVSEILGEKHKPPPLSEIKLALFGSRTVSDDLYQQVKDYADFLLMKEGERNE